MSLPVHSPPSILLLSSLFPILGCISFLPLLSSAQDTKQCHELVAGASLEARLAVAGEKEGSVTLPCDTSNSFDDNFKWMRSSDSEGVIFEPIFIPGSQRNDKLYRVGSGSSSALVVDKVSKDSSGFYCCELFHGSPYKSSAEKAFGVLVLPANFQPILSGMPLEAAEVGSQVTLTCTPPSEETRLGDKIVPTVKWQVPSTVPQPEDGATEFTFSVKEALNGAQFRCLFDYPQIREFPSEQKTLGVKFAARFLEAESTDNRDPVAVELTGSTTISCAFEANPPVEPETALFQWKRTLVESPQTGMGGEDDGDGVSGGAQCDMKRKEGVREEKVVPDEDTELVPTSRMGEGGVGAGQKTVTVFSLTIKNFDSDKEGCYTCSLSLPNSENTLSRSFNLIDQSTLKSVDSRVPLSLSLSTAVTCSLIMQTLM